MTLGFILCYSASACLFFLPRFSALLKKWGKTQKGCQDDLLKIKSDGKEHLETTQITDANPGGIPLTSPQTAPEICFQTNMIIT